MPTVVVLQSIFEHHDERIDVYVIHSDLTDTNIQLLNDFIKRYNAKLHIITISEDTFKHAPLSIHISKESYYRLAAWKLLPEDMERILYLDGDLIVTKSLRPLYEESFRSPNNQIENYFIVCEGTGVSQKEWKVYDTLQIPRESLYFNSGVILMNLELLRREVNPQLIFDYIAEHVRELKYHDQDTLNALFYNRCKYVDWHVWNQTVIHIKDSREAAERLEKAAIIHYAGSSKPWQYNYNSWFMNLFWEYARTAGFSTMYYEIIIRRMLWHIKNKLYQQKSSM